MSDTDWVDDTDSEQEDWVDDQSNSTSKSETEKPWYDISGEGLARGVMEAIPAVGAIGGGFLGTVAGPVGSVAGAGVGYASGKELEGYLKNKLLGDDALSADPVDQLKRAGGNVFKGAAYEMGGQVVGKGIEAVPRMFNQGVNKAATLANDGAEALAAHRLGAENPLSAESMQLGRHALDNDVITPLASTKTMMHKNASLETPRPKDWFFKGKQANAPFQQNTQKTGEYLSEKLQAENAKSGWGLDNVADVVGAMQSGGMTLPLTAAKEVGKKYGVQNAALGLDKVSELLKRSPQMAELSVKNPQVFSAIAQKMLDQPENNQSPKDSKPYEKEQIFQKVQGSKYATVLQNAAQRGDQSFNSANFVLQQTDPEYRKMILGDEE